MMNLDRVRLQAAAHHQRRIENLRFAGDIALIVVGNVEDIEGIAELHPTFEVDVIDMDAHHAHHEHDAANAVPN